MRRAISMLSAIAVAAVLPLVATPAQAAPETLPADEVDQPTRTDNRSHPLEVRRTSLRQRAVDELVSGAASLKGRGQHRTIQMADGVEVDYPASQHANLLTFLVEFGDTGPLRNQIPEPGPDDNSTYWKSDFDREHYLDMFFDGMPEQGDESFKDLYREMSSGRFDLQGDVSDWVTVPEGEASYGVNVDVNGESNANMTRFISDAADAWIANELTDKTESEIRDYLAQYDVWDRYDSDGDGDFNEPDGYIDHFQAVHAGEGEEAQNPGEDPWMIWSHRWAANLAELGMVGPTGCDACAPWGGIEIGDTGYWIFDYTTEPENGGLGVFAHEFGHDLGLPDYYDTGAGDNGTGFWNLMSAGSWLGHGDGSLGTTPGHMGATEKLFLGWFGPGNEDLEIVDGLAAPQTVTLGPSYHSTSTGKQAVLVDLPNGSRKVTGPIGLSTDGDYLYSGARDATAATATGPEIALPSGSPTLTARVAYNIETNFDYAYLQVSTDSGGTWTNVETSESTDTNPYGANLGEGITGSSGGWVDLTADLTAYAGQSVRLRWDYITDTMNHGWGLAVDAMTVGGYSQDFTAADDWNLGGFHAVTDYRYQVEFAQYYLAENRQYRGYDHTLATGPYSLDYALSAPDKVDHFPYQDGLLIWYANGFYADNNSGEHPGGGAYLPIDAGWKTQVWRDENGIAVSVADGRQQAYDSTFDVDQTDALSLRRESGDGELTLTVPAQQSTPVFEDTDVKAYLDDSAPPVSTWYSTKVAGVGTEIQVLSSNETTGQMVLKVGKRFVASLGGASLSGTAQPGSTLTATAPAWFQQDVTTTVAWLRDGTPIPGASGTTYQVQGADVGHTVSARVTGAKDGYTSTTITTSGLPATQAGAPTATAAPRITGTARVGRTLKVAGAQWSVPGTSTYAWTVDGKTVGAGASYQPKPADAGKQVTVTETFAATGYATATASATSGKVAKAKVSLKVSHGKAKRGKKVSATIRAASPDLSVPGKVKLTYAGTKLKAAKLKKGKVTVKLPAHKAGRYKLKVTYPGAAGFGRTQKTVKIKVK